jgi:hypothetical protein
MYIMPRLSLLEASSISLCACPSTLRGMQGWELTPSSVPFSRPAGREGKGGRPDGKFARWVSGALVTC